MERNSGAPRMYNYFTTRSSRRFCMLVLLVLSFKGPPQHKFATSLDNSLCYLGIVARRRGSHSRPQHFFQEQYRKSRQCWWGSRASTVYFSRRRVNELVAFCCCYKRSRAADSKCDGERKRCIEDEKCISVWAVADRVASPHRPALTANPFSSLLDIFSMHRSRWGVSKGRGV